MGVIKSLVQSFPDASLGISVAVDITSTHPISASPQAIEMGGRVVVGLIVIPSK